MGFGRLHFIRTLVRGVPLGVAVWAALLFALPAGAQQGALDRAIVRNRLYALNDKFELGASIGVGLLTHLVRTTQLQASIGFNFTETWALDIRAGYALSGHTGLAGALAEQVYRDPAVRSEDFSDLWEMKLNGSIGVRWAPIYGKFSLLGELPIHFKAYVWAGGGAARMHRESILICTTPGTNGCDAFLGQNRTAPMASVAVGLKLFTHRGGAIRIELRDYSFRDAYLVGVDRERAKAGGSPGTPSSSPGWTHLGQIDLGYTLHF